jgi:hypothetical protein
MCNIISKKYWCKHHIYGQNRFCVRNTCRFYLTLHYAVFAFLLWILLCAIYPTHHFPTRWIERLFLVTHCLPALYKGPFQQSDSLCRSKDPQVRAQTQEHRVRFSLYFFFILGGWIFFLLKCIECVNYNPGRVKIHFGSGGIRYISL